MTPQNQRFLQLTIPPAEYPTLWQQRGSVDDEVYWERIPTYLIARCPLCGASYTDKVDAHSLAVGWGTSDTISGTWFCTQKYQ
jgi:hypothetical protein